ncbi:MAG: hypothetical protein H6577_18980 [Lewinellaceae bacterium]|nr:hypothetical protein [Lewinellaceae bacterium]
MSIIAGGKVYQLVMEEDVLLGYLLTGDYHTYCWKWRNASWHIPNVCATNCTGIWDNRWITGCS